MKRSQVNRIVREADALFRTNGFVLPPFAHWTPDEMHERRAAIRGIVNARLGWDITDYGRGDFARCGLSLFTLRNGTGEAGAVPYAEKLMLSRRDQVAPLHCHIAKTEDIINRGGGVLAIQLYASTASGGIDEEAFVSVPSDGMVRRVAAGGVMRLEPGESVTLVPGVWHAFWAEHADVMVGEVSTVNDDVDDNVFAEPVSRFVDIDEDEAPERLLVSDYPEWLE